MDTTHAPPVRSISTHRRPRPAAVAVRAHAATLCWPLRSLLDDDTWVTTRIWLRGHDRLLRPDLCVLSGDPPSDGIATRVGLAVVWAPVSVAPRSLLAAGAGEVWQVSDDRVAIHRVTRAAPQTAAANEALAVPGTAVTVPVDTLLLRQPEIGA